MDVGNVKMAKYILRAAAFALGRAARFFLWIYVKLLSPPHSETFFYYAAIRVLGFNFKGYITAIPKHAPPISVSPYDIYCLVLFILCFFFRFLRRKINFITRIAQGV